MDKKQNITTVKNIVSVKCVYVKTEGKILSVIVYEFTPIGGRVVGFAGNKKGIF